VARALHHVPLGILSRLIEAQGPRRIHDPVVLAVSNQHGSFDFFRSSLAQVVFAELLSRVGQIFRADDPAHAFLNWRIVVEQIGAQVVGTAAHARRLDPLFAAGGSRHGNQGFFYEPTVITDVPDDSKIMTEEPFGPLAPIVPFKTFDEVVERANSLQFGLAAYAFTTSEKNASAISDALQSGMVGVNSVAVSTPETPFGGVKESGYGSEGGIEGLQAYLNTKFISQG